jgi:hypothetical protein
VIIRGSASRSFEVSSLTYMIPDLL